MNKSITICYCLRNDNYQKNFLEKFIFSLNFNLSNIKKLSLLDRFEIVIIDVASEIPINKKLLIYNKEFEKKIKIYHIPQEEINLSKPKNYKLSFFIEKAMNLYLKNSKTDFIITSTTDNLFSTIFFQNLIHLIDNKIISNNKIEKTFFMIPRVIVPLDFIMRNPSNIQVSEFIEKIPLNRANLHPNKDFIGGGFGAFLASKYVWFSSGGFDDEEVEANHSSDSEIYFKILNEFESQNLGNHGIFCYKMENTNFYGRHQKLISFGFRKPLKQIRKNNFLAKEINFKEHQILKDNIFEKDKFNFFNEYQIEFNENDKKINLKSNKKIFYKCLYFEKNINYFLTTFHIINLLNSFKLNTVLRFNSNSVFEIYSICKIFKGIKFFSIVNSLKNIHKLNFPAALFLSDVRSALFKPINIDKFENLNKNLFSENEKNLLIINQKDYINSEYFKNSIFQNASFVMVIKIKSERIKSNFYKMEELFQNNKYLILANNKYKNLTYKQYNTPYLIKNYLKVLKSYLVFKFKSFIKK